MKAKIILAITICLTLTSCSADFIDDNLNEIKLSSKNNLASNIKLTSENYLAYDSLFDFFGPLELKKLEEQINSSKDDEEIAELKQRIVYIKNELKLIIDVSKVYSLPVPCVNLPNGKCVPTRLEFFVIPNRFKQATVKVQNAKGETVGVTSELSPMPEFGKELFFLKIPVLENEKELTITFITTDKKGIQNSISGTIIRG